MKIVEVNHLSFSYDGEHAAIKDVSFSVEEGSYVAIIGHNGSGKSTLAKILMGLLNGFEGEVKLFDTVLSDKTIISLRKKIGIVFQNPDNQFVGSTVADDIAFGLENHEVPHEEMEGIIQTYASEVGMSKFLDHEPESLSGGQKQRVAIAGVLAMKPELVIFDEATAMLDPKGKKEIADIILRMKRENPNLTILSITHDVEEANRADEVLVLNEGKLFLSGKPSVVFAHQEELHQIQLDCPFLPTLIAALKKRGIQIPDDINDQETLEEFLCQ